LCPPQGIKAEDGDRFYQSYHGRRKILRVTKKIRYCIVSTVQSIIYAFLHPTYIIRAYLSGLVGNLKTSSLEVFKFYGYLKDHVPQVPLLPEEKRIASSEVELSSAKLAELMKAHGTHQVSLKNVFAWQQENAAVSGYVLKWSPSFHRCI